MGTTRRERKNVVKVVFVSPYIKRFHTGGGEKHLFDVALSLPRSARIFVAVPTESDVSDERFEELVKKYESVYEIFLGRSLKRVTFIRSPLFTEAPWYTKLWWTRQFSHLYYVTDGSLFFSLAHHNLLHIQTPLVQQFSSPVFSLKKHNWQSINTNSFFTKKVVEQHWGLPVDTVMYPAVSEDVMSVRAKKKNSILAVGRFFPQLHSKRQDILVESFARLLKEQPSLMQDWQLVFVGAIENQSFFDAIKEKAVGLPISFETDIDRAALVELYGQARLFWHATGYEVDPEQHPEKVEHFGISTVEAMAAGCVPLVIPSGGQAELLPEELEPYAWHTIDELIRNTTKVLKNPQLESRLRRVVRQHAQEFSSAVLEETVRKLFYA